MYLSKNADSFRKVAGFLVLLYTEAVLILRVSCEVQRPPPSKDCLQLIKDHKANVTLEADGTLEDPFMVMKYSSEGYDMNVTFTFKVLSGGGVFKGPLCLSMVNIRVLSIRRVGDEEKEEKALVVMETNRTVLIGATEFSFLDCAGHPCPFYTVPGLLDTAAFKYSPLSEKFWTSFNDVHLFNKKWINAIEIYRISGHIPSSWVIHLRVSSLHWLVISGNDWEQPEIEFGELLNLDGVDLSNNSIKIFPNGTFNAVPELQTLILNCNSLLKLPYDLGQLNNLFRLLVGGHKSNDTLSISDNYLSSLKNIKDLEFNNIRVRVTFCNFFNLMNLEYLFMDNCDLLDGFGTEENCVNKTTIIRGFQLKNMNLTDLPWNIIKTFTKLENFDVSSNLLDSCPGGKLKLFPNLDNLIMDNNMLSYLNPECFVGLGKLTQLNLSRNRLVSLEKGLFRDLKNLVYLDISHNELVTVHYSLFLHLDNLGFLNLSYNKIREAPGLGKVIMEEADLSHNELRSVINLTWSVNVVRVLNLSWNFIREIRVKNVEALNLSYNSLDHVPDGLTTIPENLTILDFGGNNFTCCHKNNIALIGHNLNESSMILRNLGSEDPFYCYEDGQRLVFESSLYNTTLCLARDSKFLIEVWTSLGVFLVAMVAFMSFVYHYRTELAYLSYLAKRMKRGALRDEQKYDIAIYDAFVCYCGINFAWVLRHLLHNIENTDDFYRLCIHDRDFTLGAAIDTNVLTSMDKSRKVIFVLSREFMASKWCLWELEMATHKMFEEERYFIILVELESVDRINLPKQLLYLMGTRVSILWPGEHANERQYTKFWGQLRQALGPSIFSKVGRSAPRRTVLEQ